LLSTAAVPIAIPSQTTGIDFDGGTLVFDFSGTPTDPSGHFSEVGSSAVNIGVEGGALVTFGNPLGGSGGLNVSGSGSGSTLELTEASGSNVGFNGSGGVTITGGTLFLTGNNNIELGSNTVTVTGTGILTSNSTKLVTSGSTIVGTNAVGGGGGGTITAGSGARSSNSIGVAKLSGLTLNPGGTYVVKVETGNIPSGVATPGTANDELTISSLTLGSNLGSGNRFNISLLSQGTTTMSNYASLVLISNSGSGSFTLSDFNLETTGVSSSYPIFLATADSGAELVCETPEPTSLLLGGLAISPLMLVRRRRRLALISDA
jgi:hypothetical protein